MSMNNNVPKRRYNLTARSGVTGDKFQLKPERRYASRHQDTTTEKLIVPIHLNVREQVKSITADELPWSLNASRDKRQREWPYILQPPLKPRRLKRKNKLPEKNFQTEQKYLSKTQKAKKTAKIPNFFWQPPDEKISVDETHSSSSQSYLSSETMINMDVLCKKMDSKSKFLQSNTLPKYVLRKSSTSIPNWVRKKLPKYINPETIIQAGKAWHKSNECTWAIEAKNIATFKSVTPYFVKKSPKVDWGNISACALQKKKFDFEYRKSRSKKKNNLKTALDQAKSTDRDKSCKAHFYHNIGKKKVLEPIIVSVDPPSAQTLSPYESIADIIPPFNLTHELYRLSYNKKDDYKKKYTQPDISGIEKPWKHLTERKWSSNIATTTLFSSLVKPEPETSILDASKYPVYGQWPYVENMVKTMNTTTGTFKTRIDYNFENRSFSSNRNLETGGKIKKKKTSSLIIAPVINPIKKFDDSYYKQTSLITELEHESETIPSTLNQQKLFPGFIESQATSIKPFIMDAPFTYQLSNLHLYELNYTYLTRKETYLRTLIYYSTFNNKVSHDPFQVITTKRYLNKVPYLDVPSSGLATIYYPSGKAAIQCAYSCIENRTDLLTRRYTIRSELTQRVEAIFDSLGNGIVYDKKGNIIFNYSQNFGVRIQNNRLYKWRWHNIPVINEVTTEDTDCLQKPQNIPNNEIEEMQSRNVNIYDQYIRALRASDERSLDSNHSLPEINPIAHKPNGDINYGVVTPLKPFTVQINEYIKLYVKNQKHMELKFQANEIKLTIQVGVVLNPKIVLGRESINYHLLPQEKIVCKFDKIAGETESLIKILKYVGNGKKLNPLKYKTKLIDFNDKAINLIEDEILEDKLKNDSFSEDIQVQPLSDHTLRVKNKENTKTKSSIRNNESITHDSNKNTDQFNEEERVSDIEISKFYHLDNNLLEGSNPIASNVSLLINNKSKLKQFLIESKHRK